ncbi:hypothetical protein K432DRAFT_427995 [Lepidopterella palustris CBS 459.81]|uniref:Uncharacterized protein n=1 Tax=Lepidopterella palustris CBS 459.81 TaxID=1314670 RepID=A0A8E2E4X9_9PEZI|nr:hypothetical protein K432DRAFT_427995 [Lepidopterella palustris CBS 459.81]
MDSGHAMITLANNGKPGVAFNLRHLSTALPKSYTIVVRPPNESSISASNIVATAAFDQFIQSNNVSRIQAYNSSASNACAATTPPSSPSQPHSRHGQLEQLVAFEVAALFKDMVKIAQATPEILPPPPPGVQVIEVERQSRIRASKVEFKLVKEIWDGEL